MAKVIWTEPALQDLDQIAEYIALDNPAAASCFVKDVFSRVGRLESFPKSGKRPKELPKTSYRELASPVCRIFYRIDGETVYILHVMRSERSLRSYILDR